ncbi:MAG: tetratricopeptide repeat protein [Rhodanobacteraceae bacterium]
MAHEGFWHELKRRHVYRVAAAYAVVGWLLIQVVTQVFPIFHFTGWIDQAVVLVILIGFPIALVLAWTFDVTSHGIVQAVAASGPAVRRPWRGAIAVGAVGVSIAIIAGAGYWWWHAERSPQSAPARVADQANTYGAAIAALPIPTRSVAVLPFENLSGDPNEKYFSDGITEEILNALAQIPDLKVAGRTSAFRFNSKDDDLRKIGESLGVADVLEGSVQEAGDEVRITVQLVDARTGYQLWSEKYDRKLTNIFAIEDDISSAVAGKLRVQLTGGAGQALVAQQSIDPRAHDFYLQGLTLLAARGPGVQDAAAAFQNAVQLDPQYADAWGELAMAETQLPFYVTQPLDATLRQARSDAQHALTLDPDVASAHVALGVVHSLRWQWAKAGQSFHLALALAPNDAEAIDQYAQFLFASGQFEPALREIERAHALDPLAPVCGVYRSSILQALHRHDEAEEQIKATLASHPDFVYAYVNAMTLSIDRRRFKDAEAQARLAAKLRGYDPDIEALVIRGIADPTQRATAVRVLEASPARAVMRRDPIVHAMFLVWLDQGNRALDLLEGNLVGRTSIQTQLLWLPAFDPIRNNPRFKAVLEKMGLPYMPR